MRSWAIVADLIVEVSGMALKHVHSLFTSVVAYPAANVHASARAGEAQRSRRASPNATTKIFIPPFSAAESFFSRDRILFLVAGANCRANAQTPLTNALRSRGPVSCQSPAPDTGCCACAPRGRRRRGAAPHGARESLTDHWAPSTKATWPRASCRCGVTVRHRSPRQQRLCPNLCLHFDDLQQELGGSNHLSLLINISPLVRMHVETPGREGT